MAEKKAKAVKDKDKPENKETKKPREEKEISDAVDIKAVDIKEEKDEINFSTGGETADFSGKYIKAVGRRKQAVAKVRLYEGGKGIIMVNGLRAVQYFPGEGANIVAQPLKVTGHGRDFNFSILAQGGGKRGQVGAVRLGISRAILAFDPAAKEALKANDFLVRDERQVERKKPGLRKARKAPQWSKR